jgi:hypothetical protein
VKFVVKREIGEKELKQERIETINFGGFGANPQRSKTKRKVPVLSLHPRPQVHREVNHPKLELTFHEPHKI